VGGDGDREDLATHKLESFVKTTGGKGLRVVTPLAPGPSWEQTSAFARGVAERLAASDPRRYTPRMAKTERRGKIFIDYLRNVRGATSVAAYSTRATPRRRCRCRSPGTSSRRAPRPSLHDREAATTSGRTQGRSVGRILDGEPGPVRYQAL
jgi:hypothetical protein